MENMLDQTGEIVSWNPPSSVSHSELQSALSSVGLDPELSPDMQPRNGFKRAISAMQDGRIIRQVSEDTDHIVFQFTREYLDTQANEFEYSIETQLSVNKVTGNITCDNDPLRQLAKDRMTEKQGVRNASDVSRIVQALFAKHGDMISLRKSGGCYFVPFKHVGLVQQCEDFMIAIGGDMPRHEVHSSASSPKSAMNVAKGIRDTLKGLVEDYHTYASQIDNENPKQTQCAAAKIADIRFKLSNYRTLLQSFDTEIDQAIRDVTTDLESKVQTEAVVPEVVTPEYAAELLEPEVERTVDEETVSEAQKLLAQLLA